MSDFCVIWKHQINPACTDVVELLEVSKNSKTSKYWWTGQRSIKLLAFTYNLHASQGYMYMGDVGLWKKNEKMKERKKKKKVKKKKKRQGGELHPNVWLNSHAGKITSLL